MSANLDAIEEIAKSSEELRIVLLPFINRELNVVAWHGVDQFLLLGTLQMESVAGIQWSKVLCGIPLENQQTALFNNFEKLNGKVRLAILKAVNLHYEMNPRFERKKW